MPIWWIDQWMAGKSVFPLLVAQSSDFRSGCWSAATPQIHLAHFLIMKTLWCVLLPAPSGQRWPQWLLSGASLHWQVVALSCSEGSLTGVCVVRGTGGGGRRGDSPCAEVIGGSHAVSAHHYYTCPLVRTAQIFMSYAQQRGLEREQFLEAALESHILQAATRWHIWLTGWLIN